MTRVLVIIASLIAFTTASMWTPIASSAHAFQAEDEGKIARAEQFVETLTHNVFDLLEDKNISESDKRKTLNRLIHENIGIDLLAMLMLAQEHRKAATASQIAAYDDLSRKFVADLFIDRIGQLGEHKLDLENATLSRRGDVIVRTHLKRKDGSIVRVDWRLREKDDKFRVINLSADGVSLVIVKRAEFTSITRKDGFDALLKVMRDSIKYSESTGSE